MARRGSYKNWWIPFGLSLLAGCITVEPSGGEKASEPSTNEAAAAPESKTKKETNWAEAAKARMTLGLQYLEQGNIARAKTNIDKAVKYKPDLAEVQYGLAYYYQRVNEPKLAEEHYRKALSVSPRDPLAHNIYGAFLCDQGRYEEAEDHFDTAVRAPQYNQQAATLENAGVCALKAGNKASAEQYFIKALGYNPGQGRALLEMGNLAFERGDLVKAQGYLRSYLSASRHTPRSLWLSIRIAHQTGDRDTEASNAMLLTQQFPGSEEAKLYQQTRTTWQR